MIEFQAKSIKRNQEAKFCIDQRLADSSAKGQIINIFSFAGSAVSVLLSTLPLWCLQCVKQ